MGFLSFYHLDCSQIYPFLSLGYRVSTSNGLSPQTIWPFGPNPGPGLPTPINTGIGNGPKGNRGSLQQDSTHAPNPEQVCKQPCAQTASRVLCYLHVHSHTHSPPWHADTNVHVLTYPAPQTHTQDMATRPSAPALLSCFCLQRGTQCSDHAPKGKD